MSAILELLLRLAYVLLAALGLRAFERQWKAGLRRDAELDELLAIAEERRQRRPIARVPRPSVRGARGVRSATKDGGCSGKGERRKWPRRSHGRSALDHEREAGRPRSTPSAGAVR